MLTHDLVIIGGGPAGLSTALHLQRVAPRLAERTVVVEAERYPRDKICAGGIGARGLRVLERLDVAVDCPMVRIDALALRLPDDTVVTPHPGLGYVVRRVEFDHALARVARSRGLAIRDATPVENIAVADDHVRVELAGGEVLRAQAIVGADGVAGVVRRQAGFAPHALRAQALEVDTGAAAVDLPRDTIVFDLTARDLNGYAWDFPTQIDGVPHVSRGAYVIRSLGPDAPRARLDAYLAQRGLALADYRVRQYAERGLEPEGAISQPRVLLVGEAAGIDIATGEGIAQAIEYGAAAGRYLADAFAAGNLRFSTWRHRVDRDHLGRQLWIRHACYRSYFGPHRAAVERMLPRLTKLIAVGVQDFAGTPLSPLAMLGGAGQALVALVREGMRERS